MGKATMLGELLLLVGLLAVAYLLYVQQDQIVSLTLEVDRVRGAIEPPDGTGNAKPKPQRRRATAPKEPAE